MRREPREGRARLTHLSFHKVFGRKRGELLRRSGGRSDPPRVSVTIARDERGNILETCLRIPRSIDQVFAVFADARNLERLTPPVLRFEVLTADPIVMRRGLLLDYRLRLHGIPFRWQSEITAWEPPHRFVDSQRRGPFRWWIHEHVFLEDGADTLMSDRVRYGVPGGRLVHALLVARDLRMIFRYRAAAFGDLVGVSESIGECP